MFTDLYSEMHNKDLSEAKFKIGDKVKYVGDKFPNRTGEEFIITGVNDTGLGTEYSLLDFPYLVWEDEIE